MLTMFRGVKKNNFFVNITSQKHKKLSFKTPSAFMASLRPLVVGEINADMLLEPAKPAALNNTVN